jgi:hypothetical protein
MDRGMLGNWHVPCGAGEKPEITSNAYLLLTVIYPVPGVIKLYSRFQIESYEEA